MALISKTIAITGATGFIGRDLVRFHLKQGDIVRILSRRSFEATQDLNGLISFQGDLIQHIPLNFLTGVDILYHLAAELHEPSRMRVVNVEGTSNLLTAAVCAGVRRWVQLSSVGVYGPPTSPVVSETTTPIPANEYERTKLAADLLVEETCRQASLEYSILRPSNVVGSNMKNCSFFALVAAVRRRRFFYIGPHGAIATYVHVDDVVRALVACGSAPNGGVYNISSDCTWEVLIERISDLVGVSSPRLRVPLLPLRAVISVLGDRMRLPLTSARLAALTNRSRYSTERIIIDLGFTYSRPMPDGIEDVVKAMR